MIATRRRLSTTVHHCWFDGSDTRNPRAGYGKVHVFNCLYNDNDYGIGLHSRALVLAERNHFENVKHPIKQMYREDPESPHHGFCEAVDNIFQECRGQQDDEGVSFPVNDFYLYDFALNVVGDVPANVKAGAGPGESYGTMMPLPFPGNGTVDASLEPDLRWTRSPGTTGYEVAFGDSRSLGEAKAESGQTFDPGRLGPGKVYWWRVDRITAGGTLEGDVWRFRTAPSE